jgi:two-component system CheB/CheR fusion protein
MPKGNGMAFVVIQHLDPNHVGIMPELLQRITTMKVFQASDELAVHPNCVYVIPSNKSLSILNDTLHLFDPVETRGLRLPVDYFFRSLAADRQEKSVGIILSGMGSDGSLGLKAIKEKNGIVLVQDPETAKFDGMPTSATEAVIPDIVARAEELPAKLITFLKYLPAVTPDLDLDVINKSALDKIIILLREKTGHDFSLYKKNTLLRRIERRKSVHQIDKMQNYVRFLQESPHEVEILFKELLIGVTNFFRDPAVWDKLKENVLPDLLARAPDGAMLRAWVTACSTGEEAYSLAIVFKEVLEKIKPHRSLTLQIFATDIDADAIEMARKAVFSSNIIADVSPERLSRFFKVEAERYTVNATIREMVVFAPHNVIKDPPFTKIDLLTCRNMLIYMEPELQKKITTLFHYSLNPGGIMILGTAETLGNQNLGFETIDARLKMFRSIATDLSPELIDFPSAYKQKRVRAPVKEIPPLQAVENIQTLTDQLLLQRIAPASVLINDVGDILYITGRTGNYLEPAAGKTNINIHAMAREGLRHALPGAFRKARQTFDPVILRNVKVSANRGIHYVDLRVQRLESPDQLKGMILVVFTDIPAPVEPDTINPTTGKKVAASRHKELESELQRSHEELQSTREEMQTSQEELKSTNEELQSSNEELQSTNEELTTSKEEMQSLNEELQTVNAELQSKVADSVRANNDMRNLLNSTEIACLFLDKELNIRRFTDNTVGIFKLRNTDIGRPFTDLVTDLEYPLIGNHARQVLKTLSTMETSITTDDGRWYTVRIMPYRTLDDHIDGLVMTFGNITIAKKLEIELTKAIAAQTESNKKFSAIFDQSPIAIEFYDADGKLTNMNNACITLFGIIKRSELNDFKLFDDPNIPDNEKANLRNKESVRFKHEFNFEEVKRLKLFQTSGSGAKTLETFITPLITDDKLVGYIAQIQEITGEKR